MGQSSSEKSSFSVYNKSNSNKLQIIKNYPSNLIKTNNSNDSDRDLISDDNTDEECSDVDIVGDEKACYMT